METGNQSWIQGYCLQCVLTIFLLLAPLSIHAASHEMFTNTSSPIPEMSLLLSPSDDSGVGRGSILLGEALEVSLNLSIASNITVTNSSIQFLFPLEFVEETSKNVTVLVGNNLATTRQSVTFAAASYLDVDFGTIQNQNSSDNLTEDDMIMISFSLRLNAPRENIGESFFITAFAEFVEPGMNETVQIVTSDIDFAGPGVRTAFQNSGFSANEESFIPDRATVLTLDMDFPPENVTDVAIVLLLSSTDIDPLAVDINSVTVVPGSSFITFTQPSTPGAFSCSSSYCTLPDLNLGVVYAANGTLQMQISFTISQTSASDPGDLVHFTLNMGLNGQWTHITGNTLTAVLPDLTITSEVQALSRTEVLNDYTYQFMLFTTTVSHTSYSTGPASLVSFYNSVDGLDIDFDTVVPDPYVTMGQLAKMATRYTYSPGILQVGETAILSYEARLTQVSVDGNVESDIVLDSQLTWSSIPTSEKTNTHPGLDFGPKTDSVCLTQAVTYEQSLLYNHGLAALFFFVALLVAFVLVVLCCFLYAKTSSKGIYGLVQPEGTIARNVTERGLIINPRAGKTGLDMVEEYSSVTANESIIIILMQKDKTKKVLDFENLDIIGTITTDIELEEQRISAMMEMFMMLLSSWGQREHLPRDLFAKLSKKYKRGAQDSIKRLDDEYRHDSRELIKQLSRENKGKLIMLKKKHDAELRLKAAQARSLNKEDLKEVLELLKKGQAAEVASMSQLLRLKQDEEQEKLRKEYATKKRITIKALQQTTLDQAILGGKLDEDQARAMLSEHQSRLATVERLMDEEMSRQRMALEEKLARRKLLAVAVESQAEHHSSLLNTMAHQTMTAVGDLESSEQLSPAEVQAQTEKLMKEVRAVKENYEKERSKQEEALHKKLSDRKKKRMLEKEKEQKQELAEFEKEKKSKVESGDLDPEEYFEAKSSLLSSHRGDLADIETAVNEESRQELETLRDEMAAKVKGQIADIRKKVHTDLQNKGLTEKRAAEIIEQHERDVEELMEQREEQKQKQEKALKKRLAKQRKELVLRKQEEKDEREQIREHEEKMVGRLMASQVAMSEEERRRILAEHEQHLVAMENSLALSKLRQRRLLEEKMAARKNRQMERLARKQEQEAKRKLREKRRDGSDGDEEEAPSSDLKEMMQKHSEERIAVMTEEDANRDKVEEEMEAVRVEMLHERAHALKEQEDRLGAVMAQLQMEKAREIATIEEHHRALLQLKMNMLDELTETGIMKNAQCKKVLETHQKQMEAVEQRMKKQRAKSEAETKRRLKEKAAEREKVLALRQAEEMKALMEREKSGTAARLKKVALKHKHMVQMEEFRNKLEIEIAQSMEEIRRQSEVTRLKDQQEQELEFLSALVKVGKYERTELVSVLHLLFPTKSHDQVNEMLTKLYEKVEKDEEESDGSPAKSNNGVLSRGQARRALEKKVQEALLGRLGENKLKADSPARKDKRKGKKLAPLRTENEDQNASSRGRAPMPHISSSQRPEPLGQVDSPTDRYDNEQEDEEEEEERMERSDGEGTADEESSFPRKKGVGGSGGGGSQRKGRKGSVAY